MVQYITEMFSKFYLLSFHSIFYAGLSIRAVDCRSWRQNGRHSRQIHHWYKTLNVLYRSPPH